MNELEVRGSMGSMGYNHEIDGVDMRVGIYLEVV